MSDANRALALRAKPASGLVASRFDHGDFYSSGGVFLSQLYALHVLRQLSPMECHSVLNALGESQ